MNVVMLFFWAVDMPISCFTAVNRDGVLDFRPRACIHDYLRSWCFPDALLILTDVTVTIAAWLVEACKADGSLPPASLIKSEE